MQTIFEIHLTSGSLFDYAAYDIEKRALRLHVAYQSEGYELTCVPIEVYRAFPGGTSGLSFFTTYLRARYPARTLTPADMVAENWPVARFTQSKLAAQRAVVETPRMRANRKTAERIEAAPSAPAATAANPPQPATPRKPRARPV